MPRLRRIRHTHASGRFDRSPWRLFNSLNFYVLMSGVLTLTEVVGKPRAHALARLVKWGAYKADHSDAAVMWRKRRFSKVDADGLHVGSTKDGPRKDIWGSIVALKDHRSGQHVVVSSLHLIADVEARVYRKHEQHQNNPRADDYDQMFRSWVTQAVEYATKHGAKVLILGVDTNLNFHRGWVQRYAVDVVGATGLHVGWVDHMPKGGSHGKRLIDWSLLSSELHVISIRLLRQRKASDHRAFTEVIDPNPAPDPATPKIYEAIVAAKAQSATGIPKHGAGECLMAVRECYDFPAVAPDAIASWNMSQHKHRTTSVHKIPRGVPVYWSGGSDGHGHIAISNGDGTCWSTDIRRIGRFDRVPIAEIHTDWGLALLGWSEEVNGFTVPQIGPVPK